MTLIGGSVRISSAGGAGGAGRSCAPARTTSARTKHRVSLKTSTTRMDVGDATRIGVVPIDTPVQRAEAIATWPRIVVARRLHPAGRQSVCGSGASRFAGRRPPATCALWNGLWQWGDTVIVRADREQQRRHSAGRRDGMAGTPRGVHRRAGLRFGIRGGAQSQYGPDVVGTHLTPEDIRWDVEEVSWVTVSRRSAWRRLVEEHAIRRVDA